MRRTANNGPQGSAIHAIQKAGSNQPWFYVKHELQSGFQCDGETARSSVGPRNLNLGFVGAGPRKSHALDVDTNRPDTKASFPCGAAAFNDEVFFENAGWVHQLE